MSRQRWMILALGALLGAACDPAPAAPPDAAAPAPDAAHALVDAALDAATETGPDAASSLDAATPPGDATVPTARLESLIADVSGALCGALDRCCDGASRGRFFAPMRTSERVPAEVRARIPEDGSVLAADCEALVADVFDATPLGPWVRAALDARVEFQASEADACLATLEGAACGAELSAALYDGTCFAFQPPGGGAAQRRAFTRSGEAGDACVGIADGVGASFFGTCDPSAAFCCLRREGGNCVPATMEPGVCVRASQVGEACGFAPLQLCATGLECGDAGTCEAPSTATLAAGELCAEGFTLLGDCEASFCDFGGTDRCEALRADGDACGFGYECASGLCDGALCAADNFCASP